MKNIKKSIAILNSKLLLVLTLTLCLVSQQLQAQFVGAALPNKHMPKPVTTEAIPTSTTGALGFPTFYNARNNGSCYNGTFDFDGDLDEDNVNVWAICHKDVAGYDNAVAYEVTDVGTGAIIFRGCRYLGADLANLQVGICVDNSAGHDLVVAYWSAGPSGTGEIKLTRFPMTTAGLGTPSTSVLYTVTASVDAQHIGLDCHDLNSFTIVWEDQGYPACMQGFDYSPGGIGAGPVMNFGTPDTRIPDVAMSHNAGSGKRDAHIVYVDATNPSPPVIYKLLVDFDDLVNGIAVPTIEDTETPSSFGPYWDDFTLRIDAPDHYSVAASDWAYTYFDDDNNKIKLRMADQTGPTYTTYVVNDGSLPAGPSPIYLDNITNAGNAFPTISYVPSGDAVYVGWYTNYDPGLATYPAANNALYTYTSGTQGYIGVLVDNGGRIKNTDYNRVDADYLSNRIGIFIDPSNPWTNMYYPKICFSKNNEGDKLMMVFSCHDTKPGLIWNYAGGSAFLDKYYEAIGLSGSIYPGPMYSDIGYSTAFGGTSIGTSVFLSQKQVSWLSSPLFRVSDQAEVKSNNEEIFVSSNPFNDQAMFRINSSDQHKEYDAVLTNMDGKILARYLGNVSTLNRQFKTLQSGLLPPGFYQLKISYEKEIAKQFKLIKL